MSDEMAVSDNVAGDQPQVKSDDSSGDGGGGDPNLTNEQTAVSLATKTEDTSVSSEGTPDEKDDLPKSNEDHVIDKITEENTDKEAHIDTENNLDKNDESNNVEETEPVKFGNSKETMGTEEDKLEEEEKMDTDESTKPTDIKIKEEPLPETEIKEEVQEEVRNEEENIEDIEKHVRRGIKRRASEALSDDGPEEFKGFDLLHHNTSSEEYNRILERLEAEVSAATKDFKPLRYVIATPSSPLRASKRPRKDTDGSRPSSAMSSRSDEANDNASMSPMQRGRRSTTEMSSPLLRVPLERGWKRELVYRAALDAHSRRHADIYYYMPSGKKLRSTREVAEHLSGTGLTLENFSFFKEPLGVDDPEKEIIRDAKLIRRVESPVASVAPPAPVEGKRTPKPKPPKGASPEPATPKSPPAKIKVKSVGSRLSGSAGGPVAAPPAPPAPPAKQLRRQQQNLQQHSPATQNNADNNNTAPWKKPSEEKRRGRIANGASSPPAVASAVPASPAPAPGAAPPAPAPALGAGAGALSPPPRRRGRPRLDDTDYFTAFYNRAQESNYNVVVQIFQYLGMRELAQCARVCRLWRQLAATPALWRHVRMKNSHVSSWAGLCSALRRHGTKRLDLRKMLLPQNDALFWSQFAENICTVNTLERIEMCRCPSSAVEAVCLGVPGLRALSALAIRDALLDPAPLGTLTLLHELRLKSMAGLSLTRDLAPLGALTRLQHLSLTSIKDLGWCACEVVGSLSALESLELGECSFRADMGSALARLTRLRRVRLERGPAHHAAPPVLRALASLPALVSLELVNVDVKVGFDDALAECKNIQRLLIIPTYVSQSATTNKQVLSGVLRLKETLTHLMWGVTIELLRVTELFIDQCEQAGDAKRRDVGECIPVLKPVPGCKLPEEHHHVAGPPQVEILPLPTLQRLLSAQMPNTRLKLLRIPFHATWRQSLADFQ